MKEQDNKKTMGIVGASTGAALFSLLVWVGITFLLYRYTWQKHWVWKIVTVLFGLGSINRLYFLIFKRA